MIMIKKIIIIKGVILDLISFTQYLKLKEGTWRWGSHEMSGVTEKKVSAQTLRFWLCAPAVVVTPLRSPTRCVCAARMGVITESWLAKEDCHRRGL